VSLTAKLFRQIVIFVFFVKIVGAFFQHFVYFHFKVIKKGITMSFKFTTSLLFCSAIVLGTLGFVACGGENGAITEPQQTSSSSNYVPPMSEIPFVPTAIEFSGLDVASATLNTVKFKGTISVNMGDSDMVADVNEARLTDIQFDVRSKNMTSTGHVAPLVPLDLQNNKVTTINLQQIGLQADLDNGYTECGDFILYITVTFDDGYYEPSMARDSIHFTRSEEKCKEPESSSSSVVKVPGAPLDSFSVDVNTKIHKCINLTTQTVGDDANGDICFAANILGEVTLSSATGIKFTVFNNQNDNVRLNDYSQNYLPENPTTDDFLYIESSLSDTYPNFNAQNDKFFVAIAPNYVPNSGSAAGFYSFLAMDKSAPDANGNISFRMLIYKAK